MFAMDLLDMSDCSEQSRGRLLDDFEDHRVFVLIVQGVAVLLACAARGASSESHRRVPWCSAHLVVPQKRRWTAPGGQLPAVATAAVAFRCDRVFGFFKEDDESLPMSTWAEVSSDMSTKASFTDS